MPGVFLASRIFLISSVACCVTRLLFWFIFARQASKPKGSLEACSRTGYRHSMSCGMSLIGCERKFESEARCHAVWCLVGAGAVNFAVLRPGLRCPEGTRRLAQPTPARS